jgi:hypothetical protein
MNPRYDGFSHTKVAGNLDAWNDPTQGTNRLYLFSGQFRVGVPLAPGDTFRMGAGAIAVPSGDTFRMEPGPMLISTGMSLWMGVDAIALPCCTVPFGHHVLTIVRDGA